MRKLLKFAVLFAVLCLGIHAEESIGPAQLIIHTLREDGSTNTWTEADLREALGLMNRMYHRDIKSSEGRRRWHGDPKHSVTTNAETRIIESVETYPDGFVFRDPGKRRKLRTQEEEAAWFLDRKNKRELMLVSRIKRLSGRIAKLEAVLATSTNDLERARATIGLYEARRNLQRAEAAQTNVVTVTVSP